MWKKKEKIKTMEINVDKIFTTEDYRTNTDIAYEMNIPQNLQKTGSIIYTFGYSGVGKTHTLFGKIVGETVLPGLLQSSLNILSNKDNIKIFYRIYEIYGIGFNNTMYWQNIDTNLVFCITHKLRNGIVIDKNKNLTIDDLEINVSKNDFRSIYDYVHERKHNSDKLDKKIYSELDNNSITNFSKIVNVIEENRKNGYDLFNNGKSIKTIYETKNNPVSSRSIMFYEFLIQENDTNNNLIPYVIIDLPGQEDIIDII